MATATPASQLFPRAWYSASIPEFLAASPQAILGSLAENATTAEISDDQRNAWRQEIHDLRGALASLDGYLCLEFAIPRMGQRADAVIVSQSVILVLEFKSSTKAQAADMDQVWDYALDLKHFHQASHDLRIVPVLVTIAGNNSSPGLRFSETGVAQPVSVGAQALGAVLVSCVAAVSGPPIDAALWQAAPYHPTPTIIEAARSLYAGHTVEQIAHSEALGENLWHTTRRILDIAAQAHAQRHKAICFVTGVPGAGKTLVGLNLATRRDQDSDSHAVYLSGNGPLVAVLRAALQQDANRRANKARCGPPSRISQEIKSFIQNVHHFREEGRRNSAAPPEHVVIFDEAQRAWDQRQLASWLKRRKGVCDFPDSEPEALLSYVNRRQDWALTVCLVGGGQEINQGEAGIGNWLRALATDRYAAWDVWLPPSLNGSEYAAANELLALGGRPHFDDALHLAVSVRSFRAENLADFVRSLLDGDAVAARRECARLRDRYPIALTRNLPAAKAWVRAHAAGTERYGLLATSKAMRLKPHAIDVRVDVDPVHWFLQPRDDTRSSFYLEDAGTEFDVQGLELDWTCLTWDGDLRYNGSGWTHHNFRGSRWNRINNDWHQLYARNAYRVLLTRARQGMAIFVPPGDAADPTRNPEFYNPTFKYLESLGLPVLA